MKKSQDIEYTGALPVTLTAIDSYLENYKIYGNTVQSGTPTPENPIVPQECGERTENLWDGTRLVLNKYLDDLGNEINNNSWDITEYITITNGYYVVSNILGGQPTACFYAADKSFISAIRYSATTLRNVTLTAPTNAVFVRLSVPKENTYTQAKYIMLTAGSTAPTSYIPYGYKLPLTSAGQDVDIYIGDDTLSTEEYVDSGTGKIYRMVSGVLTPTDPPVPFPQIPTAAGSTTISWRGEGLAPSQVDLSVYGWVDMPYQMRSNNQWVDREEKKREDGEWV